MKPRECWINIYMLADGNVWTGLPFADRAHCALAVCQTSRLLFRVHVKMKRRRK